MTAYLSQNLGNSGPRVFYLIWLRTGDAASHCGGNAVGQKSWFLPGTGKCQPPSSTPLANSVLRFPPHHFSVACAVYKTRLVSVPQMCLLPWSSEPDSSQGVGWEMKGLSCTSKPDHSPPFIRIPIHPHSPIYQSILRVLSPVTPLSPTLWVPPEPPPKGDSPLRSMGYSGGTSPCTRQESPQALALVH